MLLIVLVLTSGNAAAVDSGPVHYTGDAELAASPLVTGTGTEADPYVLNGHNFNCTGSSYGLWLQDTTSHVVVSNCVFLDCDSSTTDLYGYALYLQNVSHVTVLSNSFQFCNYGVVVRDSDNCTLDTNTVTSPGYFGMTVSSSEFVELTGNTIIAGEISAVRGMIVSDSRFVAINDSTILGMSGGISLINSDSLIVHDAYLEARLEYGIYLYNCSDLEIELCTIENVAQSGIYCDVSDHVSINNNTFENITTYGLQCTRSDHISFSDNLVNDTNGAVLVSYSEPLIVTRNTLTNSSGAYGIHLSVVSGRIADNTLLDSYYGIYVVDSHEIDLVGNVVLHAQGMGIDATRCNNVSLINNQVTGGSTICVSGIELNDLDDSVADGNTISGDYYYGIEIWTCNNVTVSFNQIGITGQNGIRANGCTEAGIEVLNNTVQGTLVWGLTASDSYPLRISGNVLNGFERGISLQYCYEAVIENNSCDSSTESGIRVEYGYSLSNLRIANNSCQDCGSYGILVMSCQNVTVLEANDCSGSATIGIYVLSSPLAYIGNCTASSCSTGLDIYSSGGSTVVGGSYDDCLDTGIYIYDSDGVTVEGTDASSNVNIGLNLVNSIFGTVSNSTFNWNSDGVYVSQNSEHGQSFTINGCRLENNTDRGLIGYGGLWAIIRGNHFANNLGYGLHLDASTDTWIIVNNTFLNNAGIAGIDRYAYQCYDYGYHNDWNYNDGNGITGNGWSHLPNLDVNEDGYVDLPVYVLGSGYHYDQMPYGPKIEGPSAPTDLSFELTPYYIHLNWTAPASSGNSTVEGYYVYMGSIPDLDSMWNVGMTDRLEHTQMIDLRNGETYYFAVAGYNEWGMIGDPSVYVQVYYQPYPLVSETPITIHSDQEFAEAALTYGWSGNGSADNPYLIVDLAIDGQGWNYCLHIEHTTVHFVVRNCTFFAGSTYGFVTGVELLDVVNGRFEECSFLGDLQAGLNVDQGQLVIVDSLFDGPMGYGIFHSSGELVHVENVTFVSVMTALYLQSTNFVTVMDSLFENCYGGMNAIDSHEVLVRANEFRNANDISATSSIQIASCTEWLVENNLGVGVYDLFQTSGSNWIIVRNNTANGTMMGTGLSSAGGSMVIFENNTLSEFSYGIQVAGTFDVQIRSNTLFANWNGISATGMVRAELSDNIIRNNLDLGIGFGYDNQEVLVTRNSLIDNAGFAVFGGGGATSVVITLNYFEGNHLNDGSWTLATAQAENPGGYLTWEMGGLGNFWADWTAPDSDGDGIVDMPYEGAESTIDQCPLVHPFGAPVGLDATVGPDFVNLSWSGLGYDFSEGVGGYHVYRGDSPDAYVLLDSTGEMWYNDTSVTRGHVYYYWVSAFVGAEEGAVSDWISAIPCDAPGAPTGLTVSGGLRSFQLSWAAPADDGGAPILGYVIWRGTSSIELAQHDVLGTVISYTDLLVGDDETYYYAVTAFNQAGNGSASATVGNTTFSIASAPLNIVTLFGDGNVTVLWDAPADDGGTAITGYVIEFVHALIGNFRWPGASDSSCIITGLTNGWEYSFRVLAVNAVGEGAWSSLVYDAPATFPGSPEDLQANTGTGVVRLSWLPPTDDGGAAPNLYKVYRMALDGEWEWIGNSTMLMYQDSNVNDGTVYFYRVTAVNKAGEGDASEPARAAPGLPSPPVNLIAANTSGKVQLNWTAPVDDGGSDLLGYKIYRDSGPGFVYLALAYPAQLGYLDATATPGIVYAYRVTAVTANGEGPAATEVCITLPLVPPEAPVIDSAVQGENGVVIRWHVPVSSTVPDEFLIYRGTAADSLMLIAIINGVANEYLDVSGTTGVFYALRSSNEHGIGDLGEAFEATPGIIIPPEAPQGLTAIAGDSLVTLEWIASDGAAGYHIYRDNGTGYAILATTAGTGYSDPAVVNGIAYAYRVTAFIEDKESENSSTVLATPGTVPGAVQNLVLIEGEVVVTLNWEAPADDGGSAVQGYRVYRELNGTVTMLAMVSSLTFSDHDLISGLLHTYWIVALNAWGAGPGSQHVNVTPGEIQVPGLPAPSYLLATVGDGTVTLNWDPMTSFGVDGFVVYRSDGGNYSFLALRSSPTYTDSGLTNGATYTYRVHCFLGMSNGENASVEATPGTVPGEVTLSGQVAVDRIVLSWSVPENGGSAIIGYRLYRTPGSGTTVLLASLTGTGYVDTSVLAGVNYTYMVTALNAFGEGSPSDTVVLRISAQVSPNVDVPAEPYLSSVTGGNISISLLWNVPSDTGDGPITGYSVYRGTSPLSAQLLVTLPAGTTAYVDGTVVYGTTYYYWVSALNQWGESELSQVMSASLITLATPGPVEAEVDEGQGRITIGWSVPDEGGSSITEYRIYRRGETGDRQLIATIPAGTDTFVDGSVEAGVEYDYWVTAVNAAGEGPLPEAPVSGVPLAIIAGEAEIGPMPTIALALGAIGLLVAVVAIVLVLRRK